MKIYSRTDLPELDGVYTVDSTDDNISHKDGHCEIQRKAAADEAGNVCL